MCSSEVLCAFAMPGHLIEPLRRSPILALIPHAPSLRTRRTTRESISTRRSSPCCRRTDPQERHTMYLCPLASGGVSQASSRRTVAKRAADPALVAERERRGMVVKPDPKGKGKASGSNTFPSQAAYAPNAPFQKIVSRILGKEGERETTPMVRANPTHHIIPNNSYALCYSPHNPSQRKTRTMTSSSTNKHTLTHINSPMYLFFYRTCIPHSCKDEKSMIYVILEHIGYTFPYGWTNDV